MLVKKYLLSIFDSHNNFLSSLYVLAFTVYRSYLQILPKYQNMDFFEIRVALSKKRSFEMEFFSLRIPFFKN